MTDGPDFSKKRSYSLLPATQERIRGVGYQAADPLTRLTGDTCLKAREAKQIAWRLVPVVVAPIEGGQVNRSIEELEREMGEARAAHAACAVFRSIIKGS